MERSRAEAPIRGAASEGTDSRSGELPGVAVRQVTSPGAPHQGVSDPRRQRQRTVIIGVVAAVAVLAAIVAVLVSRSGGGEVATPVPRPTFTIDTAGPTTIDPQAAVRAAIVRDYLAAQAAYDQATGLPDGKPPNSDLPALSEHMVGEQLTRVKTYIIGMKAAGLTALGPPVDEHPRVASIKGTTAIVQDCYRSDDHVVDAKTHALNDKPGPVTRGVEATMQLDQASGVWKMANIVTKTELCPAS